MELFPFNFSSNGPSMGATKDWITHTETDLKSVIVVYTVILPTAVVHCVLQTLQNIGWECRYIKYIFRVHHSEHHFPSFHYKVSFFLDKSFLHLYVCHDLRFIRSRSTSLIQSRQTKSLFPFLQWCFKFKIQINSCLIRKLSRFDLIIIVLQWSSNSLVQTTVTQLHP